MLTRGNTVTVFHAGLSDILKAASPTRVYGHNRFLLLSLFPTALRAQIAMPAPFPVLKRKEEEGGLASDYCDNCYSIKKLKGRRRAKKKKKKVLDD